MVKFSDIFGLLALTVGLGTPLAWWLSRGSAQGSDLRVNSFVPKTLLRRVVTTVVSLPIVIPPAVVGLGLLMTFGVQGWGGQLLELLGLRVSFTPAAVILAQTVVASPFFVQAAVGAFRQVDSELVFVARTLGASPQRAFVRIVVPMAAPGVVAGATMAWARALGEFGATLFFAGSMPGRTQTMPLAILSALESDVRLAVALSLVLAAAGLVLLGVSGVLGRVATLVALQFSDLGRVGKPCPAPPSNRDENSGSASPDLGAPSHPSAAFWRLEARTAMAQHGAGRPADWDLDVTLEGHAPVTVIVGPNGAGKSTVLRLLAGAPFGAGGSGNMSAPTDVSPKDVSPADAASTDAGAPTLTTPGSSMCHITVAGEIWDDLAPESRRVGYMPQSYGLFPHLSVFENVSFGVGGNSANSQLVSQIVTGLLEGFDMDGLRHRRVTSLSGGTTTGRVDPRNGPGDHWTTNQIDNWLPHQFPTSQAGFGVDGRTFGRLGRRQPTKDA